MVTYREALFVMMLTYIQIINIPEEAHAADGIVIGTTTFDNSECDVQISDRCYMKHAPKNFELKNFEVSGNKVKIDGKEWDGKPVDQKPDQDKK